MVFARLRHCAPPSDTCLLGPTRVHTPNSISIGSAVQPFLHSLRQSAPILYNGPPLSPLKLLICMADPDSHLIHGSFAHESPQCKRHLDRFAGSRSWQTDRPTDPRFSDSNNRPHLRSNAMRPKNTQLQTYGKHTAQGIYIYIPWYCSLTTALAWHDLNFRSDPD